MIVDTPSPIIQKYLKWLGSQVTGTEVSDGWIELHIPVLDRNHDYLALYVRESPDGYELSDDGETLTNLDASGWGLTDHRQDLLDEIQRRFQVSIDQNVITAHSTADRFPVTLQMFIQAVVSVSDLIVTSQEQVLSLFRDDVQEWIQQLGIPFTTPSRVEGQTFPHRVDILLDASNGTPPRAIRAVDSLTRRSVESIVFARHDVAKVHSDWKWIAFVNDLDSKPTTNNINSLLAHQIGFVPFSKREQSLYQEMLVP